MKLKVLCLLAVLLVGLLTWATVDAATLTLRIATIQGEKDSMIRVPIYATGTSKVGALQFDLVYDEHVLKAGTVTNGMLEGNGLVDSNSGVPGRVRIGLVTTEGIQSDGAVVNVNFQIIGEPGTSSPLTIEDARAWDTPAHLEVLVNTEAGQVTVVAAAPPWPLLGALVALPAFALFVLLLVLARRRKPAPINVPATFTATQAARPANLPESKAPQTWTCRNCSMINSGASHFCGNCGAARA